MACHSQLPVEIVTAIVWHVSIDCLDVVLSNNVLVSPGILQLSYAALKATVGRSRCRNGVDHLHISLARVLRDPKCHIASFV